MDNVILVNLQKVAKSFGGSIELVTQEEYKKFHTDECHDIYDAPFTSADLSIVWKQKKIIFTKENEPTWPDIVHEMGHVFGCMDSERPGKEKSESGFFGWEYLLVKQIGAPIAEWEQGNDIYCAYFEQTTEFGDLTKGQQERFIQECIDEGVAKGNIRKYKKGKYKILSLRS